MGSSEDTYLTHAENRADAKSAFGAVVQTPTAMLTLASMLACLGFWSASASCPGVPGGSWGRLQELGPCFPLGESWIQFQAAGVDPGLALTDGLKSGMN